MAGRGGQPLQGELYATRTTGKKTNRSGDLDGNRPADDVDRGGNDHPRLHTRTGLVIPVASATDAI